MSVVVGDIWLSLSHCYIHILSYSCWIDPYKTSILLDCSFYNKHPHDTISCYDPYITKNCWQGTSHGYIRPTIYPTPALVPSHWSRCSPPSTTNSWSFHPALQFLNHSLTVTIGQPFLNHVLKHFQSSWIIVSNLWPSLARDYSIIHQQHRDEAPWIITCTLRRLQAAGPSSAAPKAKATVPVERWTIGFKHTLRFWCEDPPVDDGYSDG